MRLFTLTLAAVLVSEAACARAPEEQGGASELSSLKPHEVPEQVVRLRNELGLTEQQVADLNDLHVSIRDEKHQYSHSGGKPHNTQHQAMVTGEQAHADAMAILTPDQRPRAMELLTTLPQTVKVPPALQDVKPHEIVERMLAERERLALGDDQVRELEELHVMIRDEKHRYAHRGGKPHETAHQQMVTRSQAFADALAILSPDQRLIAIKFFLGEEG
jgi:hypothetical protein